MMENLSVAIMAKYNNTSALQAALIGGLHFSEAPKETNFPYATFRFIVGLREPFCGTSAGELKTTTTQFSVFSDLQAELLSCYHVIKDTFDLASLSYTSGTDTHVICMPQAETGPDYIDDAWQSTLDYSIMRVK